MLNHKLTNQKLIGMMIDARRYQNPSSPLSLANVAFKSPIARTAKNMPCNRATKPIICFAASSIDVMEEPIKFLALSNQKRSSFVRTSPWISAEGNAVPSLFLELFVVIDPV